jgi:tetratricopeptide (TPR) repeat protein
MAAGDYKRALDLSMLVVMQNPKDFRAHREAGRAAHALGSYQIAIDHLEKAVQLQGAQPDPEARYLLGEAYYAARRTKDAVRHHDEVRRQINPGTTNWMELLWLARIHARRNELAKADAIYMGLLARDPNSDEVQIARIEAYTLSKKWRQAEKLTREYIDRHPSDTRAPEILAWVLEAQHKTDQEQTLRARMANDPERAETRLLVDHARSLERNGEYRAAISRYNEALSRAEKFGGDVDEVEVRAAVTRLHYRITPESAVAGGFFSDPSGSIEQARAGIALPAADQVTLALVGSMAHVPGGAAPGAAPTGGTDVATIDTSVVGGEGHLVAAALTMSSSYFAFEDRASSARLGASFDLRVGQGKPLQLQAVGNLHMPWREAASTLREGGSETGVTAMAYALPFGPRFIMSGGARYRAMALDPIMEVPADGRQTLLVGGGDYLLWAPSTQVVRGQFLDEDLRWGTSYLANSLTLSYRHYEAFTRDDFGGRLDLAERGTVDELSAVARNTWPDGTFGFEARAGGGYDWARDTRLWRVGSALLVTPWERVRGSLSYDYAKETTSGFSGTRHTGWASLHLDF